MSITDNTGARYRLSANLMASTLLLAALLATWRPLQLACAEGQTSDPEATRQTRQMSVKGSSEPQASVRDLSAKQLATTTSSSSSSTTTTTTSTTTASTSTPIPCSVTKPPAGESLAEFLKPWLVSRRERPANTTDRQLQEGVRCRSNTHAVRFRAPTAAHLIPKTLAAMQPGDSIDRWLFVEREPHWMNECNIRMPRPIPIQVPSVKRETLESEVANRELVVLSSRILARQNSTQATSESSNTKRSKRSAPTMMMTTRLDTNQHLAHQQPHKDQLVLSPILFRTKYSLGRTQVSAPSDYKLHTAKHSLADWQLKPKKTTFNLSKWPGGNQKFGIHHSKSRFLVSGAGQVPIVVPNSAYNKQQMNTSQMQAMFEQLHQLDHDINRRLTGTYEHERNLSDFIDEVTNERKLYLNSTGPEKNVSVERKLQIERERHLWMPPIRELVLASEVNETSLFNMTGGLYNGQMEFVMANMTKYIELFLVAVEQMLYDQDQLSETNDHLKRKLTIYQYQSLEAKTQRLLCDAKNLFDLMAQWKKLRRSFVGMFTDMANRGEVLRLKESNTGDFFPKLITYTLFRDQPVPADFQYIESPLVLAWSRLDPSERADKLKTLELFLPENRAARRVDESGQHPDYTNGTQTMRHLSYPTHFWRDVMPLKQRQLLLAPERAVRDISIFEAMKQFLKAYKSLIFNNVPADTNLSKLYSD